MRIVAGEILSGPSSKPTLWGHILPHAYPSRSYDVFPYARLVSQQNGIVGSGRYAEFGADADKRLVREEELDNRRGVLTLSYDHKESPAQSSSPSAVGY